MKDYKIDIERILTDNRLTEKQRETLAKFKEYYEVLPSSRGGTIKPKSVLNYLRSLLKHALFTGKSYEDVTLQDNISFAKYLHSEFKDTTIANDKIAIRYFFNWLYGVKKKGHFAAVVDDPALVPQTPKRELDPDKLLTKEEIMKMVKVAHTYRNKCIVMLSFGEGGLRGGEIISLNYDSISFDERGCKLYIPESKSKKRYVRLIDSEPYLREYINKEYGLDKKPGNPLFYGAHAYFGQRWKNANAVNQLLKRLGKKAGINKRIYTHLGRHCATTNDHKYGLDVDIIAKRRGITPNTVRNVYLHLDDKDADDAYTALKNGSAEEVKKIIQDRDVLSPVKCKRCNKTWAATTMFCTCGMALSIKAAEIIEEQTSPYREKLLKLLDDPIVQERLRVLSQ